MVAAIKLLEAGASAVAKDDEGRTALHLAVENDDQKFLNLLIQNSASVNDTDNRGKSALHYAVERDNMVAAIRLLEAGAILEEKVAKIMKPEHFYTLL
jgi:ankyrin repeat protein